MVLSEGTVLFFASVIATSILAWVGRLHLKLEDLGRRTQEVETKVELFWKGIGEKMATLLHSPHTPALDVLLDRYRAGELRNGERERLMSRLREIERGVSQDHPEPFQRDRAALLLLALEQQG